MEGAEFTPTSHASTEAALQRRTPGRALETEPRTIAGDHRPLAFTSVEGRVLELARRHPSALAVIDEAGSYTYGALARDAAHLASHLQDRSPTDKNQPVALISERSRWHCVAALACLLARVPFLPIPKDHPRERIRSIIGDSGSQLILASKELPDDFGLATWYIPEISRSRRPLVEREPLDGQATAYVIYTSGSTGSPKGVAISRDAFANLINWDVRVNRKPGERALLISSFSFDASLLELWGALAGCNAAVLLDRLQPAATGEIDAAMSEYGINVALLGTTVATRFILEGWTPKTLRRLYTGGSAVPALAAAPTYEVINLYGPAECAVVTTASVLRLDGATAPIGRPIDNVICRLESTSNQGDQELLIGGAGVGAYLTDSDDREAFFHDRFGSRWYRSGDLCRTNEADGLLFCGRRDRQIQVNGVRVEPAEVESALIRIPGITEASVVTRDDQSTGPRLIAAIIGENLVLEEVREALTRLLPRPLIPSEMYHLTALPLTANGKVDEKGLLASLSEFSRMHTTRDAAADLTATQEVILNEMAHMLGEPLALEDDFFGAGGDSLQAASLVTSVAARFGTRVSLAAFFENPTALTLSRLLESGQS